MPFGGWDGRGSSNPNDRNNHSHDTNGNTKGGRDDRDEKERNGRKQGGNFGGYDGRGSTDPRAISSKSTNANANTQKGRDRLNDRRGGNFHGWDGRGSTDPRARYNLSDDPNANTQSGQNRIDDRRRQGAMKALDQTGLETVTNLDPTGLSSRGAKAYEKYQQGKMHPQERVSYDDVRDQGLNSAAERAIKGAASFTEILKGLPVSNPIGLAVDGYNFDQQSQYAKEKYGVQSRRRKKADGAFGDDRKHDTPSAGGLVQAGSTSPTHDGQSQPKALPSYDFDFNSHLNNFKS